MIAQQQPDATTLETALRNGAKLGQYSPHDLRHTFATLALRRGERVELVSRILGHAKISITLDTYRHVLPSELHAIDLLDSPVIPRVEQPGSQAMN